MEIPPGTKIAEKMVFIGLSGCIQCIYLVPLMEFAKKNNLAKEIIVEIMKSKNDYEQRVSELGKILGIEIDTSIPVPFLYIEIGDMSKVTQQEIIEEAVTGIRQELNETDQFDYLDNEFTNPKQLLNYLTKIVTDTVF
ncbi:MAG: hypothetical protein ACFFD1_05805 [Candidatus Thorarchaeota archaeon]